MSKRNSQQRRQHIVMQVQEQGEITVEQLAQYFATSEVTIRKDLTVLEQEGLLLRRHGGAVCLPSAIEETSHYSAQKLAIAQLAAQCIQDNQRIIIDSGSTTGALVNELTQTNLVVMTNSLNLASKLTQLHCEPTVLMTGGTWDARSESFQGKIAEQALQAYDFDQLFIGADSVDLARGTTTFNELIGLSQVMAEVANQVIVLIESHKIGRKMPNIELA